MLICLRFIPEFADSESSASEVSELYAELARKSLNDTYDEPSLLTIQCCLILCVYEAGEGSEFKSWLRLGHAIRLAQLLQLHKQDSDHRRFDWGNSAPASSPSSAEMRRRTFWCCFCLDKLLANGRDRIAVLAIDDISTRLPQSDEDFIYGRDRVTQQLGPSSAASENHSDESILAYTIRLVEILANVLAWHGRGGRYTDSRCPWLPDMPFTILDGALLRWKASLPEYLDYTPRNISFVIAAGQGRLWSLMFLLYFQARAYLHREYLPFTPSKDYDPALGKATILNITTYKVVLHGHFYS